MMHSTHVSTYAAADVMVLTSSCQCCEHRHIIEPVCKEGIQPTRGMGF